MRAWAVVPVKGRQRAKERLGDILDPAERGELVAAMLADVLAALSGSRALAGVAVMSPDPTMLALARGWGAKALPEERPLDYGGAAEPAAGLAGMQGWDALLVVPGDVPLIGTRDVDELMAVAEEVAGGIVVAPDRAGRGTNALLRRPPTCLPACFGPDSLRRHQQEARAARLACRVWANSAFALDVDAPDDLRLLLARGGGPSTRRALARLGAGERLRVPAESIRAVSGPITILPIPGMGEVRPGDDLAALLWWALQAAAERLQDRDLVVVTQKVVSKAEGRLVPLDEITPSEFARRFGEQWGKDPRYVEVVLRESRRIVKMDRGVLVTETQHGFVCANAGVDESNVAGGGTVSLLPLDPDASAAALCARLVELSGARVAVVISDTFGRPWRSGLVNVAIGVAGLRPLDSYIGRHDPYGFPLKVTELAVADEVASAAELVMGKVDRVPAAIVRGLRYASGGSARDLVRPPELDLFR